MPLSNSILQETILGDTHHGILLTYDHITRGK